MKYIVLDTETTGLHDTAEIVEIAVIDYKTGDVLLNSRCNPKKEKSWPVAQSIHGISPDDLKMSPSFEYIWNERLAEIISNADGVLIYNASYDYRLIRQSLRAGSDQYDHSPIFVHDCIMFAVANGGRWPKLLAAAERFGHVWDGPHHSALADARAARSVALALEAQGYRWFSDLND